MRKERTFETLKKSGVIPSSQIPRQNLKGRASNTANYDNPMIMKSPQKPEETQKKKFSMDLRDKGPLIKSVEISTLKKSKDKIPELSEDHEPISAFKRLSQDYKIRRESVKGKLIDEIVMMPSHRKGEETPLILVDNLKRIIDANSSHTSVIDKSISIPPSMKS